MIIQIEEAVLHILDMETGTTLYSQGLLEDTCYEFLYRHIEKTFADDGAKTGKLELTSRLGVSIEEFKRSVKDFLSFSTALGEQIQSWLYQSEDPKATDVLCAYGRIDAEPWLIVLLLTNEAAFTHHVVQEGEKITNQIIRYQAVLPSLQHKISDYMYVHLGTGEIRMGEKTRWINGEKVGILEERIAGVTLEPSPRESVKKISKIIEEVAKEQGLDPVMAVSKTKQYLVENAETAQHMNAAQLGRQVFQHQEEAKRAYEEQIAEASLPQDIRMPKSYAVKAGKMQKIKTDGGIELSIPIAYMADPEKVEFITQPNGQILIAIKNINKIINK